MDLPFSMLQHTSSDVTTIKFKHEDKYQIDDLKRHLSRNGYPRARGIISYNMNDVVNKYQTKSKDIITVPKKEIFIVLHYLGIQSKLSLRSSNHVFTSSMVDVILRLFSETLAESLFSPIKTDSAAPLGLK